MATLAINSARQSTSLYSPFELVYGRTPILCQENKFPWPAKRPERVFKWRSEAKELILQSQSRKILWKPKDDLSESDSDVKETRTPGLNDKEQEEDVVDPQALSGTVTRAGRQTRPPIWRQQDLS
ncbi:hypothetical protein OUZ56_003338 [Daphnia magna]|uniref:Uncharacterized protein n=1 Tax=Daphnia magna TaxID=35525 RepID=A0ABR0A8G4_9CRUS|nr:hypothetical protein OUZ56_003338 [Daphnia magna]